MGGYVLAIACGIVGIVLCLLAKHYGEVVSNLAWASVIASLVLGVLNLAFND